MAIPEGRLSTTPVIGEYLPPEDKGQLPLKSWESGPIAIEDLSEGLFYQHWYLTWDATRDMFVLTDEQGNSFDILEVPDVEFASFTFDQNGRVYLTWMNSVSSFMYWYDSGVSRTVITDLGPNVLTPTVYLDDKRQTQDRDNDILLWYTKEIGESNTFDLYMLLQRERYTIEHLMAAALPSYFITAMGMTDETRVQIQLGYGAAGAGPELPAPPPPAGTTIIWAGSAITSEATGTGDQAASIYFMEHDGSGPYDNANARYLLVDTAGAPIGFGYTSWLDSQPVLFNDYWMRVRNTGGVESLTIKDYEDVVHAINDEFYAPGAILTVDTVGYAAPATRTSSVTVDICKDNGAGAPDGVWHSRVVNLIASTVAVDPPPDPPPPVDITGAVSWSSVFGSNFEDTLSGQFYKANHFIPSGGLAIWFDVENTVSVKRCLFNTIITTWTTSRRLIQIGTVVKDFTTPPTAVNATGGSGIDCGINTDIYDYEFVPGERYIWNIRLLDVSSGYTTLQVAKQ